VEIAGRKLSSTVVYQNSRSRGWIAGLSSAGCQQWEGTALAFKLANDSILIVPSRLCREAEQVLDRSGRVDILAVCTGKQAHQDQAFIVDSASRPAKWYVEAVPLSDPWLHHSRASCCGVRATGIRGRSGMPQTCLATLFARISMIWRAQFCALSPKPAGHSCPSSS
jgi:hypothetical protein